MTIQSIKQHIPNRARPDASGRATACRGHCALPSISGVLLLALAGVFVASTAFAKIVYNTIDPVGIVADNGRHVTLTGPLAVTADERAQMRVTVSQRTTGAVVEGHAVLTAPGRLLFTDDKNLNVVVMTYATPQLFCTTPDAPHSLAQDGLGRVLVSSGTASQIRLDSPAGVLLSNVFATAQARSPLARGPGNAWGTNVYFVGTNGALQSVTPAGVVTEHGTGFAPVEDMEFGPDGALHLCDRHSDVVLRVSPPDCPPRLDIAPRPGAVRLTWTTNATGYLLETNSALTLPASWDVLTSNYSIFDTNYAVTNVLGSATRFYRLHKT